MASVVPMSRASLASRTTLLPLSSSARMRRIAIRRSSSDISPTGVPEPSAAGAVDNAVDGEAFPAAKAGPVSRSAGARAVAATVRAARVSLICGPASRTW